MADPGAGFEESAFEEEAFETSVATANAIYVVSASFTKSTGAAPTLSRDGSANATLDKSLGASPSFLP